MSNYPVGQRPRSVDPHSTLRLAALTAVVAGVMLLAAAAFVLSYSGIHAVALQAGVSPDLAKLYPVIFDAMLVVSGAAAMALRGAGWWSRCYAWVCLIALLAAVAIGDAVHATGTALPERALRIAVAITPWVLLLLAFGLLLTMLRHFRKSRAAVAARQEARAAADAGIGVRPTEANGTAANGTAAGRAPVTWATAGTAAIAAGAAGTAAIAAGPATGLAGTTAGTAGTATATEARPMPPPRFGLDFWLGPRHNRAPTADAPYEADGADTEADASHADPVSYGEETGYVHPDSYRDEGEYSPHGDSGGPGMGSGAAPLGQDAPAGHTGNGDHSPQDDTLVGTTADDRSADAAPQADSEAQADGGAQADDGQPTAEADDSQPGAQADDGKPAAEAADGKAAAQADDGGQTVQADAAAQAAKPDDTAQAGEASIAAAAADGGPAGESAQDEAVGEPVVTQGPALERVRSTPTRPED